MRYREERPKRRCCEVTFVTYALRGFWRNSQCKKERKCRKGVLGTVNEEGHWDALWGNGGVVE